jgi:cyclic beta-1,2-glucan synthetase
MSVKHQDNKPLEAGSPSDVAQHLAELHLTALSSRSASPLSDRLKVLESELNSAYTALAEAPEETLSLSYAAEWMLDNFHIVQQALRLIRVEMPKGFYILLPKLDRPSQNDLPRIYAIAHEIILYCSGLIQINLVTQFLQAYQRFTPLAMRELWALPTMLRLGILECLASAVSTINQEIPDDLHENLDDDRESLLNANGVKRIALDSLPIAAEIDDVVANSIRSLRILATYDWKTFFENVSLVEEILFQDPAGIYHRMDFETRDSYRGKIEDLALATNRHELDIVKEAIQLAKDCHQNKHTQHAADPSRTEHEATAVPSDLSVSTHVPKNTLTQDKNLSTIIHATDSIFTRDDHVGFYLLGDGLNLLESVAEYRPPWKSRLARWVLQHPTLPYLGSIVSLTFLFLTALMFLFSRSVGATPLQLFSLAFLGLIISGTVAVDIINWLITQVVLTRVLPKMDFEQGITPEFRTMVVVPSLLLDSSQVERLLQQLELHYLGNSDPYIHFALLTDFLDAPYEHMASDETLLEQVKKGIQNLNEKHGTGILGPFYLFHRRRLWNSSESSWIGWERKRGKLVEFNHVLRGGRQTSFEVQYGDLSILPVIKYVITLDADTTLPRGSARRLIATLAHPLNQAEFDDDNRTVTSGYTVLQPRIEITPSSANLSPFTRAFSGDTQIDLYSRAVSDVYQDFFGEGNYVGKGIYDVDAFQKSLEGCVPENTLLSHDLFEGVHGRTGLVSDIVLFEEIPSTYRNFTFRLHRWLRGDWQLLPWLLPRVPHSDGGMVPNPLSTLDRWKILDNLRRSLRPPTIMAILLASWVWWPQPTWPWMAVGLLPSILAFLLSFFMAIAHGIKVKSFRRFLHKARPVLVRSLLDLVFLPHETLVALDASISTLVRMIITRKHLLQWTSSAHTAKLFGKKVRVRSLWREMFTTSIVIIGLAIIVALRNPNVFPIAAPFLLSWSLSPLIAHWISLPTQHRKTPLSEDQIQTLRTLAKRTWFFYQKFIDPGDHWLPPDHYQEDPRGTIAHRTSPTNIGLMLLSTLGAYDLGYLGSLDLVLRLRATFESIGQLEQYRGHLLNWYDTHSLEPLPPRYVSTVDSGNLAACMLTLKHGCLELPNDPILRWERWQGFLDTLDLFRESLTGLSDEDVQRSLNPLQDYIDAIRREILNLRESPEAWGPKWHSLYDDNWPDLNQLVSELVDFSSEKIDPTALEDLRMSMVQLHNLLFTTKREIDMLLPWIFYLENRPTLLDVLKPALTEKISIPQNEMERIQLLMLELSEEFPVSPCLDQIVDICVAAESRLSNLLGLLSTYAESSEEVEAARTWSKHWMDALVDARTTTKFLDDGLRELANQAENYFASMDFSFLFHSQRKVFHIGYNLDADKLDSNYYDLLASEARTASLLSIAKGDVPQSHWLHLARPVLSVDGTRVLLSWNGSMFEYLMPTLMLRNNPGTLLDHSNRAVIQRMIEYGKQEGVPWGISESGFYQFDSNFNYQYRGFGVPGLGLKRGLEQDIVISPHASLLALPFEPLAVMQNITHLKKLNSIGRYGFFEAIDFTKSRLLLGEDYSIVRSYMVHHQSMLLLSIVNFLHGNSMVRRFNSDPRVRSVELLLQEQVPFQAAVEKPHPEQISAVRPPEPLVRSAPWRVPTHSPLPQMHLLSNGRYSVLISSAGGGFSTWQGTDLTRWRSDTTLDNWGSWIYLAEKMDGNHWSAAYQPTAVLPASEEVLFYPHKAEFRRQDNGIATQLEIAIAPEDDVEIRLITLTNHRNLPNKLDLTSYAEVALTPHVVDRRHPAFNKLFIVSEHLPKINTLLFERRRRSGEEKPIFMAHSLITASGESAPADFETSRQEFLGRGGTTQTPTALTVKRGRFSNRTGATLDPIMALRHEIDIEPHSTMKLAFITAAAETRTDVMELIESFQDWHRIEQAMDLAQNRTEQEMRDLNLSTPEVKRFQKLLSVLLHPYTALRASPNVIASNNLGQSALWAYTISGDHPILLINVSNQDATSIIRELLRAHAYWRSRQVKVDLVILNHKETGYTQELQGHLLRLITRAKSDAWLYKRGGIFLIRADQMTDDDLVLLQTAARVVLDGDQGSLESQLEHLLQPPTRLPLFLPTSLGPYDAHPTPKVDRPKDLLFDNGFGGFHPNGHEYIIYLKEGQSTPAPWINVIANPHFGFTVSEAGAGYTWALNSSENRLTPWHNDPVTDMPGEALFLRDEETAQKWSPTPSPMPSSAPYLVRHGAGYSVFEHNCHGIIQRTRFFVARDKPIKFIQLQLKNSWNRHRRITVTYYAEWVLGTCRDVTRQYIVSEYDESTQALLARNPYNIDFGGRVAFTAASHHLHGLTADRTEFLGRHGSLKEPAGLNRVGLAARFEAGIDPCAATQLHLELAPGETKDVVFMIGQETNRETALQLIKQYQDPLQVQDEWEAVTDFWNDLLSHVEVQSPDPAMNLLMNRWLLYQTLSSRLWGRSALYQPGGAFGFRDQLQDVMALLHAAPMAARGHILRAAGHQFHEGDVLHWWHPVPSLDESPPSSRGVRTRISDDLIWLPYVTAQYVSQTGDESILTERVSFVEGDSLKPEEDELYDHYRNTTETDTLFEHCVRALERGITAGRHGIPLIGGGDWNDGMNQVGIEGKGESVWLGWFICSTLKHFAPLCKIMGEDQLADDYEHKALELCQALESHAWDGNWYLRAYYDDGSPLGSVDNLECQIDSLAQSWAVLSDGANASRATQAMEAVADRLVRPEDQLIQLFDPPFDKTQHDPGYIKGYPPGVRENGGQYTHAAIWSAWAFAELGQGNRAEELFRMLNPIYKGDTPEKVMRYRVEPYVIAADVYSMPPYCGRGGWTWYTGSAAWMYRLGIEAILGLRRFGDALCIDPCIPKEWPSFNLTYRFGDSSYQIHVDNPHGVNQGVKEITLDGDAVSDGSIPLQRDGQKHLIHVLMG